MAKAERRLFLLAVLLMLTAVFLLLPFDRQPSSEESTDSKSTAALGMLLQNSEEGVYVLAVADGHPAARAGVHAGDLLMAVNDISVRRAEDVNRILQAAEGSVVLRIQCQGREEDVTLPHRLQEVKQGVARPAGAGME